MENHELNIGDRHRLDIKQNAILIECKDLDRIGKWKTLFCIWKEDIPLFQEAFKIHKRDFPLSHLNAIKNCVSTKNIIIDRGKS